jgi:CoA:oxalate CoA-transferase
VDILVEDRPPIEMERLGLSYAQLKELKPSLLMTSITPFGQTGPYRNYKAYPLNTYHSGGEGYLTPTGSPFHDRPPLKVGKWVGEYESGISAAGATLCGLFCRGESGEGQHIDISKQEALMFISLWDLSRWPDFGIVTSRFTRGYRSGGVLPCKDGYIEFSPQVWKDWENMFKLVGKPEMAEDEGLKDRRVREERGTEIKKVLEPWAQERTKQEIYEIGQANQCTVAPYYSLDEVVNCRHLAARQFFVEVEHPEAGTLKYPSSPFRFSGTPWSVERPAPLLGQHNEEIYGEILGYTKEDLVILRQMGVI